MSARGKVRHNDAICSMPINEHTGNEACLVWDEETPPEIEMSVPAHYKQGPQGNLIADYRADFLARTGEWDRSAPLGSSEIEDRRDNRDPIEVFQEMHPHTHALSTNGAGQHSQTFKP